MINYLSVFILDKIQRFGYFGIFLTMTMESAGILIPSEIVVPFSGFLAGQDKLNLWIVIFIAALANLTGSIILYLIGFSGGRWFLFKYGKYILIKKEDLEKADNWFQRYGSKAIFFSRLIPIIRTFISLPAGVTKLNFGQFLIFTFFGSLLWNFWLAYFGFLAGENWEYLSYIFRKLDFILVFLIIFLMIFYIFKHNKKRIWAR